MTPTRAEKLRDIRRIKVLLDAHKLSYPQYRDVGGKYSKGQIYSDGDTWDDLCAECGIQIDRRNDPIPDEVYFKRLKSFIDTEGRLPKSSERKKAGLNFSKSRWNSFDAFLSEAIERGIVPPSLAPQFEENSYIESAQDKPSHPLASPISTQSSHPDRSIPPPPLRPLRSKPRWKRIDIPGFPYAPQDENAVIALFAILCHCGIIPWQILDLNSGQGIDCICHNGETHRELRVEFKLVLSRTSWNHSIEDFDVVIYWENKWHDFPKQVIELSPLLEKKEVRRKTVSSIFSPRE